MAKTKPISGQILDVSPAPFSVMSRGDRQLAEARGRLYRAGVRESSVINRHLKAASIEISSDASQRRTTVSDSRLLVRDANIMVGRSARAINRAFEAIDFDIEAGVDRSIRRALRAQGVKLDSLGRGPITIGQRKEIAREVRNLMRQEFPVGSGLSYQDRLDRIQVQHTRQVGSFMRRNYASGEVAKGISKNVARGLAYSAPGRTPVSGGSAAKKVRRLMMAEETRLANEAELRLIQLYGVEYAYWRLSPAHPWYGGKEICEYHASTVNSRVVDEIRGFGVPLSGMDYSGLHKVSEWPAYPHPFCKCYPEPWFPVQLQSLLGDLATAATIISKSPGEPGYSEE